MFRSFILLGLVLFALLGCITSFGVFPRVPTVKNIAAGALGVVIASAGGAQLTPLQPSFTFTGASFVAPSHAATAVDNAVFVGEYSDPNHPGCLRKVELKGGKVVLTGSDSTDGSKQWVLQAKTPGDGSILVDFSPKGGPADLKGQFSVSANGIQWPDGNVWTKK